MQKIMIFPTLFVALLTLLIPSSASLHGQDSALPKIVLITLDGVRWQDFFTGADASLITNPEYVHDTLMLKNLFWRDTPEARRGVLMPFLWKNALRIGQFHGNRLHGSKVDLTNKLWFSYPGYNEILSGRADDARITSNEKLNNPNKTVLEIVNASHSFSGKVAAFGSWDVFPYIVNENRSGIPVNAGFEPAAGSDLTAHELWLNEMQERIPSPWGSVRLDAFTGQYALEYMKKNHPDLVYIAFGETDDFAHDGDYQAYLKAMHNTDLLIRDLWEFVQDDPEYRDNTIFLITTDHGRGTRPLDSWKNHGDDVPNAGEVWLVAFGNGVRNKGEVKSEEQVFSIQIAPTILAFLQLNEAGETLPGKPLELKD